MGEPIEDFELIIPEDCHKIGICESMPSYPEEVVNGLIKHLKLNLVPFNKDIIINVTESNMDVNDVLETPLCESHPTIFKPRAAMTSAGVWHLVLNTNDHQIQQYNGEKCVSSNATCSGIRFHMGYNGYCLQKYILREMIALNEAMDKVVKLDFLVPSCCSCIGEEMIVAESQQINKTSTV